MIKFGTDGWRDLMYDRFTIGAVRLVVQAIADHVRKHGGEDRGVAVGYDARIFSDRFAAEAVRVLTANGIRAFTAARDLPTPVTAFAVRQHGAFGAIIFTASHNPPEYNGIKFIPEYAGPASPVITAEIEGFLARRLAERGEDQGVSVETSARENLVREIDPLPAYFAHLSGLVDLEAVAASGLTLVVDPMYASGRGLWQAFLGQACRLEVLHDWRDPLFGGLMPDPREANLAELRERVAALPNALGLATDGDADRFGIVDVDGTFLSPNEVIALLCAHLLQGRKWRGTVARTVATTHLVDALAADYGVETAETPVGFKYLGELMRTRPVILAGEESGGLSIRGHIPEKDGLLACALAAEMRAVTGRPLGETLRELRARYGGYYSKRLDLHLPEEERDRLMRSFTDAPPRHVLGRDVVEVRQVDGVKCLLGDGAWFLLRPSGTEALIRVYVEAPTIGERDDLAGWVGETMRAAPDRAVC